MPHPNGIDLISFCPFLSIILKLLDYNDILKCNLVNRRVHQTVQSLYHSLLSRDQELHFMTKMNADGSAVEYVRIYATARSSKHKYYHAIITNCRFRIYSQRLKEPNIVNHLDKMGRLFERTAPTKLLPFGRGFEEATYYPDERIMQKAESQLYWITNFEISECAIDDTKKALGQFVYMVAEHCNIANVSIDMGETAKYRTPDGWITMIGRILEESGARCKEVSFGREFSGLEEFCDKIHCEELSVRMSGRVADFLSSTTRWNKSYVITKGGMEPALLPNIVEFVKEWERSTIRIPHKLTIVSRFRCSHQELLSILSSTVQPAVSLIRSVDDGDYAEMFIRRRTDDLVFCLAYCQRKGEIIMYDVTHSGSLYTLRFPLKPY